MVVSEIGELLRKLRGKESLRDVAERAGISHAYLSLIEKGIDPRTKSPLMPSPETLKGLSRAFNYPFEELMKAAGYLERGNDNSSATSLSIAYYGGAKTEEEKEFLDEQLEIFRIRKAIREQEKKNNNE
jgi:transcriptional regulator with XRE-family HTH domain